MKYATMKAKRRPVAIGKNMISGDETTLYSISTEIIRLYIMIEKSNENYFLPAAAFPVPPISILSKASLISCTSPKAFIVSASSSATHNVDGDIEESILTFGRLNEEN